MGVIRFQSCFILAWTVVDPEINPGMLGARQKYNVDRGTPVHHTHTLNLGEFRSSIYKCRLSIVVDRRLS